MAEFVRNAVFLGLQMEMCYVIKNDSRIIELVVHVTKLESSLVVSSGFLDVP